MFFLDDLLLRSVGISLPGLDMIWTLEQIQKFALKGYYNPEKIKNQIKETRLLYEFGELIARSTNGRTAELMHKLDMAQKVDGDEPRYRESTYWDRYGRINAWRSRKRSSKRILEVLCSPPEMEEQR